VVVQVNPRGETNYWIGPAGDARDASEGTDFHATANGYVSLTPLQLDLTHRGQLERSNSGWGERVIATQLSVVHTESRACLRVSVRLPYQFK
jgi:hypothetical protein